MYSHVETPVCFFHLARHLFYLARHMSCLLLFIIVHGLLAQEDFKCAVIVNDMAELNIDKSLIDQTSLIQSDEAMVGRYRSSVRIIFN